MDEELVKTQMHGPVLLALVDHPPANALGPQARQELTEVLARAAREPAVRCLVLSGRGGRHFISGADLNSLRGLDLAGAAQRVGAARQLMRTILDLPKPVIAAVNGFCVGGGLEIALCCDLRIAAEHAKLGLPEVKLGLMPGGGGTQLLPRLVGSGAARLLIFGGRLISAAQALRMGLVEEVVEGRDLLEEALRLAQEMAHNAPLALAAAKKALAAAREVPLEAGWDQENRLWAELLASGDAAEGIQAFLAKRPPQFKGV